VSAKIIIVDNTPDLVHVYQKFFDMAGLKVIASFFSAKEMLESLSKSVMDPGKEQELEKNSIVLLDHKMPEMNGEEAARRLRKLNPKIGIILATAEDPSKLKIEENLFDGIIQKPFSMGEFVRIIERVSSLIIGDSY